MILDRLNHHFNARIKAGKTSRLAVEITMALVIKIFLLWLLWALCFAHPVNKTDRQQAVTHIILS